MLAVLSHGDLIFQGIIAVVAVVFLFIAAFLPLRSPDGTTGPFYSRVHLGWLALALLAIITAWTLFNAAG